MWNLKYNTNELIYETENVASQKILVYLELYMTEMARQINQWGKERLFKLIIHKRKENLDPYFEPRTKFNSKWAEDLKVKKQNFQKKT